MNHVYTAISAVFSSMQNSRGSELTARTRIILHYLDSETLFQKVPLFKQTVKFATIWPSVRHHERLTEGCLVSLLNAYVAKCNRLRL